MKKVIASKSTVLEKILIGSILLLIFLTPIIIIPSVFSPFVTPKTYLFIGVTPLLFSLWFYLQSTHVNYRISKRGFIWLLPFIVLVCWMIVSTFTGVDPWTSFLGTLQRGTGVIFFITGIFFTVILTSLVQVHGFRLLKKILNIIIAASVVIAFSSFFVGGKTITLGNMSLLNESAMGGVTGNSTYSGAFILFGIFASIFFIFYTQKPKLKLLYGSLLVFLCVSPIYLNFDVWKGIIPLELLLNKPYLILGEARMAVIATSVGLLITGALLLITSSHRLKMYLGTILLSVTVGATVIGFVKLNTPGSMVRESFVALAGDNRFIFWEIAQQGIQERPITGWGNENYSYVYQKFIQPSVFEERRGYEVWVDRPHNTFLEFGVQNGYLGIVLYSGVIIFLLIGLLSLYKKQVIFRTAYSIFSGMIVAYVLQNTLAFDWIGTYLLIFCGIGCIAGMNSFQNQKNQIVSLGYNRMLLVIGITVLSIVVTVVYALIPLQFAHRIAHMMTVPIPVRTQQYESVYNSRYMQGIGGLYAQKIYEFYLENINQFKNDPVKNRIAREELQSLIRAVSYHEKISKNDYRLYLAGIRILNLEAFLEEQVKQENTDLAFYFFNQAQRISINNIEAYIDFSETLAQSKKYEEAITIATQARAMNPNYINSHLNLINLLRSFGTQNSLDKAIAEAQTYFPGKTF